LPRPPLAHHLKPVILSGAGQLFLSRLLLQTRRPAQRRPLRHRAVFARWISPASALHAARRSFLHLGL